MGARCKGGNTIGVLFCKDDGAVWEDDETLWPVGVFEDEADAANIRLDAQVTLRSVPLGEVAYLQVGSARLELATSLTGTPLRNAFGRLSLGGSAGLFPIGALPATPVRTNFRIRFFRFNREFRPSAISTARAGTIEPPRLLLLAEALADVRHQIAYRSAWRLLFNEDFS